MTPYRTHIYRWVWNNFLRKWNYQFWAKSLETGEWKWHSLSWKETLQGDK